MGALARVQRAIEAPTVEAQKLLAETPNADAHERLSILVNGWFRGIAAALEELAIELDGMRDRPEPGTEGPRPSHTEADAEDDRHESASRIDSGERLGEAALAERARASRAETQALREERDE